MICKCDFLTINLHADHQGRNNLQVTSMASSGRSTS